MERHKYYDQRFSQARKDFYSGGKPMLRVSFAKKSAKEFLHTKNVMDYFIESTWFQDLTTSNSGGYRDLYVLYDAYNNQIPESYFHYVTNPHSSSKAENQSYPARIRPYSIIRPNIDLLLGEYDKRMFNYTVITTDMDSLNTLQDEIYEAVLANLEQQFINMMNERGIETGVPSQEIELPANLVAKKQSSYQDQRAKMGQANISNAERELQIKRKSGEMFKDWLIAGETYSYKGVRKGKLFYERVSPLDIDYDKSPDEMYVEDGSWAITRKFLTPSDIVTLFWDEMSPNDIDDLEEIGAGTPFTSSYYNTLLGDTNRREEDLRRAKVTLYHATWKYYKKIGFLSFVDEMGELQEIEVPEDYKAASNEEIEWYWLPEWWEGYRVDSPYNDGSLSGKSGLYFGVGPILHQRNAMNNIAVCKGPYNGVRFSDTHSRNISATELGMPYQILYMILHYRLELTIAKSKGKIAMMDINTIPNRKGWDTEKFLYYSEALGFALIDRSQQGADKTWNQYQAIDMGLYEHITNLSTVMEFVKQEWDELLGITRQRKGQVQATETASGIDAARYQSSVISERMFSRFEDFMRTEYQGMLDYSKFSDLNSGRAAFYSDDMKRTIIELDPSDYMEADFGILVSNSARDIEDMSMLRSVIPNLSSQDTSPAVLMEMIRSRNVSRLKEILAEKQATEEQAVAAQEEAAAQREQKTLDIQQQYQEINYQFDSLLQQEKYDREESLSHIKGQYDLADTNEPGDTLDPAAAQANMLKAEEISRKDRTEQQKLDQQRKKDASDREVALKKINAERYKADTQLKIAKENKNQYDTSKKAG